jgi:hypothetical protein
VTALARFGALDALSVPAEELAVGDILGGEAWRRVLHVVAYDGGDGVEVTAITTPLDTTTPSGPLMFAGDVPVAVLRQPKEPVHLTGMAVDLLMGGVSA